MNADTTWNVLENFSVERLNANTWKVRTMNFVGGEEKPFNNFVSRVCFTVVRNQDNCFDGYSLTDFDVEEEVDVRRWAKAYYDYLTTDPEEIFIIENNYRAVCIATSISL